MSRASWIASLVGLLRRLGHESALVGGLAVALRARERFTRDVDLAVILASDHEAEELGRAMQRSGFLLQCVLEQESLGVIATLRFRLPASGSPEPDLDLLCASCGIESEIVAAAKLVRLAPGMSVPVAATGHLIAMKVLSAREGREQDISDLRALFSVADDREVGKARNALRLIDERGFHRGKNLEAEFERYCRDLSGK